MSIVKVSDKQIKESYDGFDLYFDHQDKILYSSINALSRWTGASAKTIKQKGEALNAGKEAEALTAGGLQGVTLFTSTEVVAILDALIDGKRTKPETKAKAKERLKLLATLGNELGGMLAIAPEELAKIAISRTTTQDQVNSVSEHLNQHGKYLKEYHGLHDELKLRGAEGVHHATVNKHNNQLAGVRTGSRDYMTEHQRDELTFLQLAEKMKLNNTQTGNAWQAVNVCKKAGSQAKIALNAIMGQQ
jgi:hypothetical protein